MVMRALTVRQPWAWCIAAGYKDVENRARSLGPYTGLVAIHAGAAWSEPGATDPRVLTAWAGPPHPQRIRALAPGQFQGGFVIAVAKLTGSHPVEADCCFSRWADHEFGGIPVGVHLVLADAYQLPTPVPCTGRLGLWTLPPSVEASVAGQLPPAVPPF